MVSIDFTNSTTRSRWRKFFVLFRAILNEKHYRVLLAAFTFFILGNTRGSVGWIADVAGVSRSTISIGRKELESNDPHIRSNRVRRKGGGRKPVEETQPGIEKAVEEMLMASSYGNPQDTKARIYSTLSVEKIKNRLEKLSAPFRASAATILRLVKKASFTQQQNRKALQCGKPHANRDAQFQRIDAVKEAAEFRVNPLISIDAKAKEFLDRLFKKGKQWRKKGDPEEVQDHDFPKQKVTPYGVYDLIQNNGFVNLGISCDTAQFAVESIRRWWHKVGKGVYPYAKRLIILCDGGGSNSNTARLWKYELARLAEEIGLPIEVHHYPPGCSKHNPVEHRFFNIISMNWAGKPFEDVVTVLKYIISTKTRTGLRTKAQLDQNTYEKGIKVSDEQYGRIRMIREASMGEWNYVVYGFHSSGNEAYAS